MDKDTRRQRLLAILSNDEPITGHDLAQQLGVTRQVVVHDIALQRAQGANIVSTPRGYWLPEVDVNKHLQVLSVVHPPNLTAIELYTLVDFGIRVLDVQIEHPVYGELKGSLQLASRRDVELFLAQVQASGAALLSSLTDGQHMHTVAIPGPSRLAEAIEALRSHGIQVFE